MYISTPGVNSGLPLRVLLDSKICGTCLLLRVQSGRAVGETWAPSMLKNKKSTKILDRKWRHEDITLIELSYYSHNFPVVRAQHCNGAAGADSVTRDLAAPVKIHLVNTI